MMRWCYGGLSAIASAGDANAGASFLASVKEAGEDCDIPASQADLLTGATFIGGEEEEEKEGEVFSTPPLTQQDPQKQNQSQGGQAGAGEDGITMCSMPVTQTQPSPSPSSSSVPSGGRGQVASKPRKPRVCTRKVSRRAKIRTPTPSPSRSRSPSPELDPLAPSRNPTPELDPLAPSPSGPKPNPLAPNPSPNPELNPLAPNPSPSPELNPLAPNPSPSSVVDPLARIVLMIPTRPLSTTGKEDILELARSRGITF